MRGRYYCPNCKATLDYQTGFSPSSGSHVCTRCGAHLADLDVYYGERFENVSWYCDSCGAFLNKQDNFSDLNDYWDCTECGYRNSISEDDIQESTARKREPGLIRALNAVNKMLDKELERRKLEESGYQEEPEEPDAVTKFMEKLGEYIIKGIVWLFKSIGKLIFLLFKGLFILLKKAVHYFIDPQKDGRIAKYDFFKMRLRARFCNHKQLPIGNYYYDLLHKNVKDVKIKLYNNGFKRIKAIPIKDLSYSARHRIGEVEQVVVNGTSYFEPEDVFSYNTQIIITYHDKKKS